MVLVQTWREVLHAVVSINVVPALCRGIDSAMIEPVHVLAVPKKKRIRKKLMEWERDIPNLSTCTYTIDVS